MIFDSLFNKERIVAALAAKRHADTFAESLEALSTTTDPEIFFSKYNDARFHAEKAAEIFAEYDMGDDPKEVLEDLIRDKDDLVCNFIDRCHAAGTLDSRWQEIQSHKDEMSEKCLEYMFWLLQD